MTQKEALEILKTGANVFLTGAAGSGKTHILREYLACLKERKIPVGVTASTGIAATHMGGVTIHSWSGIGVKDQLSDWDIDEISQREKLSARINAAKVLVIDEISMLHHYQLDMVNRVLKSVRNSPEPFGGLQAVVCGDFFQLPPVSRRPRSFDADGMLFIDDDYDADGKARFAYHSRAWREAEFAVCYLEENYRQSDEQYLQVLNAIRNSAVTDEIVEILKSRFKAAIPPSALPNKAVAEASRGTSFLSSATPPRSNPSPRFPTDKSVYVREGLSVAETPTVASGIRGTQKTCAAGRESVTRLYSHNANVDAENERELAKLKTPLQKYEMTGRGKRHLVEALKKSCLAPEVLKLKDGAKVMFVKNNFEKGFVNGTTGIVKKCTPFEIVVATDKGHVRVETESWHIEDNGKILAEIEQYPLRLAWAITIHKSQGMSLDAAEIDLSQSFEKGMGYVALSRVKTLDGLSLSGLNKTALEIHGEALEYDKSFREQSDRAAAELAVMPEEELKRRQTGFLGPEPARTNMTRKSHASRSEVPPFSKGDFARRDQETGSANGSREPKIPTTERTRRLLDAGMTVGEAAAARGLKAETIINHIGLIKRADDSWDISRFRSIIPADRLEKIIEAFNGSKPGADGLPPLTPVKQRLGAGYSYEEIKIARLFL
ncbi:AAA family ATPase [Patescibacteria group bacterium]|nr:AAA family ATPase [Patescibacteria group bacterium]MDE1946873.1 AAA family ATPase [Patescibacteria group bacterium]MDE2010693.1 AAA family ATPase [Patescibacteria group bacterium]